jgi:replicative DNA helicase
MVVVAGFPSTGKTALSVNIAVHNAIKKVPAAIFSAEMLPVQLVVRSLCSEARANFKRLLERDQSNMVTASAKIANSPLYIEQANGLSIGQVTAIARRLKQKHNIQMIVVDYIQLLSGTGDNREQVISSISKGIKSMAMELDLPVLALSQLTDDGKLRESRAIGQDADSIWKLENEGDWQPVIQPIKLNIEKCRDGATGKVSLTFMKEFTRFESAARISDEDVPN